LSLKVCYKVVLVSLKVSVELGTTNAVFSCSRKLNLIHMWNLSRRLFHISLQERTILTQHAKRQFLQTTF